MTDGPYEPVDDDDDDDAPLFWDVIEEQYGRPLTDEEWRRELEASYEQEGLEFTEADFQDELARQKEWQKYKTEVAARERARSEADAAAHAVVEDLFLEICSPPLDEHGELTDEGQSLWKARVNKIIRTRLSFESLLLLLEKTVDDEASRLAKQRASKRHAENHAMRDEVYAWLDANKTPKMSLDDAATEMAGKLVPLTWRSVRDHCIGWNRLRSASKP